MVNLIRMDLYRMRKSTNFIVLVILAFLLAASQTPIEKLLSMLAEAIAGEGVNFPPTQDLSTFISNPYPMFNSMLAMLAATYFFYADMESGYIKNIAGQMPRKGYSILSRYLAAIAMNLLFMVIGVVGNLLGTVFFRKIVFDAGIADSLRIFALRFLLMHSVYAIILLVTATFRNKSLGLVISILMGSGLMFFIYAGIDSGLDQVFKNKNFSIDSYMPDQLLGAANPKTLDSLAVSAVTIAVFLLLAIRIFDRKDVK